jgi:uncharacterized protein YceK
MRRVWNGIVLAGAASVLVGLSGCASVESVERAQMAADRAQQSADRAQMTASNAQAAADRATQVANAARASADQAVASVNQSRSEVVALNQQVESMRPRVGMRD